MSESKGPKKADQVLSRRSFVQSTALLTGVSVTGAQVIESSALGAEGDMPARMFAQAAQPSLSPKPPAAPAMTITPGPPAKPEISLQEFITLSEVLTGLDGLEPDLADEYLQRCAVRPDVKGQLKNLVQTLSLLKGDRREVENKFADKLKADDGLFLAAEQIIYLWYIGAFYRVLSAPGNPVAWECGPPEHYFRGKVWGVIGVKPPMTAHDSTNFWSSKPTGKGA